MTAPIASITRSPAPSTRLSERSPSTVSSAIGLRRKSCVMELEIIQRRPGGQRARRAAARRGGRPCRSMRAPVRRVDRTPDPMSDPPTTSCSGRWLLTQLEAIHPACTGEGLDDVEPAVRVERETLRPAETVEEGLDRPGWADAVNGIARRERRRLSHTARRQVRMPGERRRCLAEAKRRARMPVLDPEQRT